MSTAATTSVSPSAASGEGGQMGLPEAMAPVPMTAALTRRPSNVARRPAFARGALVLVARVLDVLVLGRLAGGGVA
jgi:hypothetical protein